MAAKKHAYNKQILPSFTRLSLNRSQYAIKKFGTNGRHFKSPLFAPLLQPSETGSRETGFEELSRDHARDTHEPIWRLKCQEET